MKTQGLGDSDIRANSFTRARNFLLGTASVLLGQYIMLQREPLLARFVFTNSLNELFRIDVPNLDNVIVATVLLFGGGAILFGVFRDHSVSSSIPDAVPVDPIGLPSSSRRVWLWMAGLSASAFFLFLFLIGRLSAGDDGNWLAIIWLSGLGLAGYVAFHFDQQAGRPLSAGLQRRDLVIVLGLVLLAVGIGAFDLTRKPFSLMGDEGSFWETAQAIAIGQYRPSIFDLGVYTYPILGSFYQALILRVFGLSLWSWRFASVLAGAVSVAPTYLLAREMFDRRVALLAGAAMIVMPYLIAFERLGYNNSQSLFPVTLTLYFLYAGLKRTSVVYLFLGGGAAGLGFYTYTSAQLGIVCAMLFFAYLFLKRHDETRRTVVVLGLVFVAGWGLTALPRLAYNAATRPEMMGNKLSESLFANVDYALDLFGPAELYRDYPPIPLGNIKIFYRPDLYARLLVRGLIRTFLAFHHNLVITEHFIDGPLPGPFAVVFYFLGLTFTLANLRRASLALLAIWFFSGWALLSVINSFPPRHQHLVVLIPVISILTALGLVATADLVSEYLPKWRDRVSAVLVAINLGVIAVLGLNDYFFDVQATYPPSFDQVITFTALNLQARGEIVYVYDKPAEKDNVPYGISKIPTFATFRTVSPEELAADQFSLVPGTAYTFIFHESDQTIVFDYLSRILRRSISPLMYRISDPNDTALSYSFGQ